MEPRPGVPAQELFIASIPFPRYKYPIEHINAAMATNRTTPDFVRTVPELAARFGALVREHREAMKLRQDDLALATGVGRRFIIDLEAGKPTCQLGKALLVAMAVGLRPLDVMGASDVGDALPDMPDDVHG